MNVLCFCGKFQCHHYKLITYIQVLETRCFNRMIYSGVGTMLKIVPAEIITFTKVGNELVGTVDILNIVKTPITYKVN